MWKKIRRTTAVLLVAFLIVNLFHANVSATETGECWVMNSDCTIFYDNKTFAQAASLTQNTTNYWIDVMSDITTDGAVFRGTNLSINLNSYKVTGNFTITNGVSFHYRTSDAAICGTVYVTGGKVTVEEGMNIQDWELSGGTFNFEPTENDLASGYEAVDNGDGTWSVRERVQKEETIAVEIDNIGSEQSGAIIAVPEEGWTEGGNTFSVSCEQPCIVAVSYDNGKTYIQLSAEESEEGYTFTVEDMTEGMIIAVCVKGDSNGDGAITNADITGIQAVLLEKNSLDPVKSLAVDVNSDGSITNADLTKLRAVYLAKTSFSW